mmetsp:Transcript_63147/g.73490  ORF Transcript_63147/g.73490 Transcript_63147/m.73490 type:complete len:197 (-) Transcript_63147:277-867(-)
MLGASVPMSIAIIPGEYFKVLAGASTLRRHLTDAYWCHNMELVCDGKLEGQVVRFTGTDLVLMRFRCPKAAPSGKRYTFAFSIPAQYLVPVSMKRALGASVAMGSSMLPNQLGSSVSFASSVPVHDIGTPQSLGDNGVTFMAATEPFIPHLCVVCGRWDLPGEIRRHGYKCYGCIGTKSLSRLRNESSRLKTEVES